jgi:hypothetical protein
VKLSFSTTFTNTVMLLIESIVTHFAGIARASPWGTLTLDPLVDVPCPSRRITQREGAADPDTAHPPVWRDFIVRQCGKCI